MSLFKNIFSLRKRETFDKGLKTKTTFFFSKMTKAVAATKG
jgi:fused signal recognition particle receptor